jgi:pilus assembly protein CpaC
MYANLSARLRSAHVAAILTAFVGTFVLAVCSTAGAQQFSTPSLMQKLSGQIEKLELTTNTSRILTLDKNIPRVQVNNPDLLAVTPLSANQVQISAKKAGVTQVNLWDEDGQIHTVDVLIYGDVQELQVALQTQFPNSSIKVFRYSESLVLKGFIDQPEQVTQIMQIANDYAPKVINNMTVGGAQQVLLKVRVMEVSRTKLRELGVDWAWFGGGRDFAINSVGGLIETFDSGAQSITTANSATFNFGIIGDSGAFFGVLRALQNHQIAKILAEPNIVAISGRPAEFNVGGEVPILVPQSLGTTSIEYKKFGTQIDFLPIVLGNGNIRLEVRPRISFLDPSAGIVLNDILVPGFNVRQVNTAVEMKAGQTFALAGLVQERTETRNRGLPYLADVPFFGVPFRRTFDEVNEIELLIVVTPEFVEPISPGEAPCGGPGYNTTTPDTCDLYCKGHVEVPPAQNPISGMLACGECGGPCAYNNYYAGCGAGGACGPACGYGYTGSATGPVDSIIYDDTYEPTPIEMHDPMNGELSPDPMMLPPADSAELLPPQSSTRPSPKTGTQQANRPAGTHEYTVPRPYSPERHPTFVRNATSPQNRTGDSPAASTPSPEGGLFGPVGYDAQ